MRPDDFEAMHTQSRELYCEEHGVPKIKTPHGHRTCLFCEREEWEEHS